MRFRGIRVQIKYWNHNWRWSRRPWAQWRILAHCWRLCVYLSLAAVSDLLTRRDICSAQKSRECLQTCAQQVKKCTWCIRCQIWPHFWHEHIWQKGVEFCQEFLSKIKFDKLQFDKKKINGFFVSNLVSKTQIWQLLKPPIKFYLRFDTNICFSFLLSWYDNPTFLLHSFSYLITNIFRVIGSILVSITFLDIEPSWTSTSNLEPWNLEQVVSNTVIMCIYVRVNFACVYVCMHVWAWKWLC
jgi:hypothetical protein